MQSFFLLIGLPTAAAKVAVAKHGIVRTVLRVFVMIYSGAESN
ncbi:hypothetical protein SAMN04488490_0662 [Marinobacter sp. LV10R510-11A]|nr:hypothetical protein SAMN04488490_0662 [Marinobacter sp. LV10R510-11A]